MVVESFRFTSADMVAWKVLSFLALDSGSQEALIGPADQWFMKERKHKNPGANYLYGLMLVCLEYGVGLRDKMYPNDSSMMKLYEQIRLMLNDKAAGAWSIRGLHEDAEWKRIREIASNVLESSGLLLNPPESPFHIPDYIELDGYDWR